MHFLGAAGMPRRIADYPDAFAGWNFVEFDRFLHLLRRDPVFRLYRVSHLVRRAQGRSQLRGEGATTLEWSVSSPPPFHSYDELPILT